MRPVAVEFTVLELKTGEFLEIEVCEKLSGGTDGKEGYLPEMVKTR